MKKLRYLFAAAISGLLLFTASPALAQPIFATASSRDACNTLEDLNPNADTCDESNGLANRLIKLALNLLSIIAGVIAVLMIIVAGFKYVTAQGDATELSNAKKSLIYALVGLVVVALSQAIVKFVLARTINA